MKKIFYLCSLVLVSLLLSSNKASAYSITYHNMYDSCARVSFFLMVSDSSGTNITETSYGDGITDTTTMPYGYANYNHVYATSGTYTIEQVWIHNGVRVDSLTSTLTHSACGYITGRLYHDVNTNCSFDAGDRGIHSSSLVEVDSAGTPVDTITAYSTFAYKVHTGGVTFAFMPIGTVAGLVSACPVSGSISATSVIGNSVAAGDLGFQCGTSTAFDVAVNMVSHNGRHTNSIYVTLTNTSCTTKSGTLTVVMDSHYTYSSTYPSAGVSVSGHTVTISYSNLSIDTCITYYITGNVYPWLTPGTNITTTAYINHLSGDGNLANDSVTTTDTVTSSWDPNDKQVMPKGNILPGTRLTYTLSFENTGNAPAKNIHIIDTLDATVDPKSVQVVASSFPATMYTFLDPVSHRTILRFDFVNINLLDSTHHGQCDGYVMFGVNAKGSLTNGTDVPNRAGIYFDDNEVVMTNTVHSLVKIVGVPTINNMSQVQLYPNPVQNDLVIKTANGVYDQLSVINNLGQVLMQQTIQGTESHVDMHTLAPGMYFIMLKGVNGLKVEKIEKL